MPASFLYAPGAEARRLHAQGKPLTRNALSSVIDKRFLTNRKWTFLLSFRIYDASCPCATLPNTYGEGRMNKTIIGCTLGLVATGVTTTAAILVAIWMTWADTNDRIASLDTRMSAQLVELSGRVGRIEGILTAQGDMRPPVSDVEETVR